jgi:hypothetical protein
MADYDIHYDPITINTEPVSVEIKGLDNIKNTIRLETPQPVKGESKAELVISQPIRLESKGELVIPQPIRLEGTAEVDIKPLVLDQCLNIRLSPLPPTCIRLPYQQHIGLTLFGVEVIGFNLAGEAQVLVSDLPSKPQIAWGGEQAAAQPAYAPAETAGGVHIRLSE